MNFDWKNYLEFSKEIIENPPKENDEAYFRSAVSRAYYSVFKLIQDYFDSNKFPIPEKGSSGEDLGLHQKYIECLKSHHDDLIKEIGTDLDELRIGRLNADYKKGKSHNLRTAEIQVRLAEEVLQKMEDRILCY